VLPGCGGGKSGHPIPSAQANRLIRSIQAADQYSSAGRCQRARTKVRDARYLLGQIPRSVDTDVRQSIADGLDRLDSLIVSQCQAPQTTQTDTTQTDTTRTDTTQTDTTQTDTTPTQTTETQTTPTQTTLTQTTPTDTTPTQTGTGTGTGTGTSTGTTTTGTGGTPPNTAGGGAGNQG
jgi:uncharacterized alpha-E superfamily protein